jgi:hypothetical protein
VILKKLQRCESGKNDRMVFLAPTDPLTRRCVGVEQMGGRAGCYGFA